VGLREKIENNIIVILIGAVVASGSICAGVSTWFAAQRETLQSEKWQSKLDDMESRITSVERRIGGQKFFDIKDMFGSGHKTSAPASLHIAYFPQGHYSAVSQLEGFSYKKTSEGALFAEMNAQEIPSAVLSQANTLMVDAWVGKPQKLSGSSIFKELLPIVFAETVSLDQLNSVTIGLGQAMANLEDSSNKENMDLINDKELASFISKNYNLDAGIQILIGFLNLTAEINGSHDSNLQAVVQSIQKVGPVLYFQMIFAFSDVKVNNKHYDKYFYVKEVFIINTPGAVTLLDTQVPTDNPFVPNAYFSRINEWLTYFHVENM